MPTHADALYGWLLLSRLGEAQILLPLALFTGLALCRQPQQRRWVAVWMLLLGLAVALTTASKLAFIGWGYGIAAINFTGISGHTMFASAVYPVLLVSVMVGSTPGRWRLALLLGVALAVLLGCSRMAVGAHSPSEVLAGLVVGGSVSVAVLVLASLGHSRLPPVVPMVLLVWVLLTPAGMPASQTHSLVTRLALWLSGHTVPYTREDMLRSAAMAPG